MLVVCTTAPDTTKYWKRCTTNLLKWTDTSIIELKCLFGDGQTENKLLGELTVTVKLIHYQGNLEALTKSMRDI